MNSGTQMYRGFWITRESTHYKIIGLGRVEWSTIALAKEHIDIIADSNKHLIAFNSASLQSIKI